MRTLLIIGAVLLIAVGLLAFALLNLNSLIASNKEQILQQVEQTLGREVAVEEIGVTVWGGIGRASDTVSHCRRSRLFG